MLDPKSHLLRVLEHEVRERRMSGRDDLRPHLGRQKSDRTPPSAHVDDAEPRPIACFVRDAGVDRPEQKKDLKQDFVCESGDRRMVWLVHDLYRSTGSSSCRASVVHVVSPFAVVTCLKHSGVPLSERVPWRYGVIQSKNA